MSNWLDPHGCLELNALLSNELEKPNEKDAKGV